MKAISSILWAAILVFLALMLPISGSVRAESQSPFLASWNDGAAKKAIVSFVERVTNEGGADHVPAADRIATFDNDGTLWVEQPIYVQAIFALDRARELASKNPRLASQPLFKAILQKDQRALAGLNEHEVGELLAATHAGMTPEEFSDQARHWLDRAKHPHFGRHYTELTYQPMLELLDYLRANDFRTFIVSGGGVDFIRAVSMDLYGIPPEQVIGSSGATRFVVRDGVAGLIKLPKLNSVDDKAGKPVNINLHIGRRPILSAGNSDGDQAMLQYTGSGARARLMLLVRHDDAAREYVYDRHSEIGRLDKALDEATARKWTVVSMRRDWKVLFPHASPTSVIHPTGIGE